jgi:carbon storage regulator
MLVLTRKIGEEIVIAGDIRVTVLSIRKGHTVLGLTAPATVPILRSELCTVEKPAATAANLAAQPAR